MTEIIKTIAPNFNFVQKNESVFQKINYFMESAFILCNAAGIGFFDRIGKAKRAFLFLQKFERNF
jgi:hypothetical protein